MADSQTNFVYAALGDRGPSIVDQLERRGIAAPRSTRGVAGITAGAPEENRRLVTALDEVM